LQGKGCSIRGDAANAPTRKRENSKRRMRKKKIYKTGWKKGDLFKKERRITGQHAEETTFQHVLGKKKKGLSPGGAKRRLVTQGGMERG